MLDNLRRTLSAPAAVLTLVAGWTVPGSSPAVWTGFILVAMALPALLPAFSELVLPRPGVSKRVYVRAVARGLALAGSQLACHLAFLAHQAWLMSDAIVRTLVRLGVTRRTMLEWVTAARTKAGLRREIGGAYRRMHGAIALAVAAGMLVALVAPERRAFAPPFILLCVVSPLRGPWAVRPTPTY